MAKAGEGLEEGIEAFGHRETGGGMELAIFAFATGDEEVAAAPADFVEGLS